MSGNQDTEFRAACSQVVRVLGASNVIFEFKTIVELRESTVTLVQFVDWLLSGHIHFIITHVHQGLESFGWDVEDIYTELQRLQWHPGFPTGNQLSCPVFTQNKMQYIKALQGMTMRTFDIPISDIIDDPGVEAQIDHILKENSDCTEWIMKAPFTTNSQHFKWFISNSQFEAMSAMNRVTKDLNSNHPTCYAIPYMMLQEKAFNNTEPKIVYLNKQFSHFAGGRGRGSAVVKSLPGYTSDDLIKFGHDVIDRLSNNSLGHNYILDGLVRIDMFKSNDGKLVLNEVESLEAGYKTNDENACARVATFIQIYWETKIFNSIHTLCNAEDYRI